jgi:outer membrane protein insertion porin family
MTPEHMLDRTDRRAPAESLLSRGLLGLVGPIGPLGRLDELPPSPRPLVAVPGRAPRSERSPRSPRSQRSPGEGRRTAFRLVAVGLLPWVVAGGMPLFTAPMAAAADAAEAVGEAPAAAAPTSGVVVTSEPTPPTPPSPPAAGGEPPPVEEGVQGKRLAAIEVKGLKTLSEETMIYYLGLEIGKPLDEEQLNKSIKSLWDRGLVDDVKLDYASAANGVKLIVTVAERPILKSIDYEGLKRLSKTDVQDKIATQRIHVREGEPLSLGELQRVKTLIEDLYREKGYRFAQASYTVQDLAGNEKKVVFKVDEGDRVRIAKIYFTGNHVLGRIRLHFAMKDTKESNWITRILKKDVYDPAKLQDDLDKIRDLYKSEGYKNVSIGEPKIEVKAKNPNAALAKDQNRRMFITIPIEESDRWKLGKVTLDGNKVYPDLVLRRAFKMRPGDWLRSKEFDDEIKKVNDTYHNTGYVFARVEPEMIERPNNVADVVVHISEGEQFKVGRIEFQGNERTQDKVLRREIRLFEGGLVNIGAVKNSVLKVNQLGYFKLEEEDPVDIDTNSEKKEVNLLFKGHEANRTELQFGGGWSELDGFFVQFSVSTKNFLGRGESVGVSVQTGYYRKVYDVNYTIPWWLDKPQNLGFRAFISDLDYTALNTDYIENAKGIVLTYGRNLGLFNSWSVSYNYTKHNDSENLLTPISGAVPGTPTTIPINSGTLGSTPVTQVAQFFINTSSIKPAWNYDSRDNPFQPTHGLKVAGSLEYGGGPLGGNDNFLRPDLDIAIFRPVTTTGLKTVFAFNAEAGLLHPTTDKVLSPLEYFFIGGENSIRGMRFRSVTVRDSNGNAAFDPSTGAGVGGDKYVTFNTEFHFLVGGPFRILAFFDAGNVYGFVPCSTGLSIKAPDCGRDQGWELNNLRKTAGIELRVTLPILGAPLRFIYSKNLQPLPLDEFETFQFSIGTSF